jgi:UDP-N-acetyl-D-mannosaminuronate dehydrogenase
LGITYRAGVKEAAFSGALDLLNYLEQENVNVFGIDPFYSDEEILNFGYKGVADLSKMDGVIIHTDHPEFKTIDFERHENLKFIYDGMVNKLKQDDKLGFAYLYDRFLSQDLVTDKYLAPKVSE